MQQTVLLPVDLIGKVSDRALILYALMADRAKSSAVRAEFIDSDGVPFVIFTVDEVARRFGIGQTQAKLSLKELENAELIVGKCQGMGQPKHYYVKTDGFPSVKTGGKPSVKTGGKPSVKTGGKPSANQSNNNQSEYNQSSDDDIIEQIVENYLKLPQFSYITPEIANSVVKNVKNALKKSKIANIKAYIRTCLVSALDDCAVQLSFSTASGAGAGDNSGYSATYDLAAYESVSAADSEILDEGEVIQ